MTNRLQDIDRLVDQISQELLKAQLAQFSVGRLDEQAMLGLSMDALDTADVVEEYAIATGDAATAVGSVDSKPASLLAGELRTSLARDLKESSAWNDDGANLLRQAGAGLAEVVKVGRERRAKAKSDREMDQLNRDLLRRVKEATAPTPLQQFEAMYYAQQGGEASIEDRIAQRQNLAEREAIDRGVELTD